MSAKNKKSNVPAAKTKATKATKATKVIDEIVDKQLDEITELEKATIIKLEREAAQADIEKLKQGRPALEEPEITKGADIIDTYLSGTIAFDKVRQLKKGGPFCNSAGEIFVPLALIR